jgi:hypothetical protein
MQDLTYDEAVDVVASVTREIGAAHATLSSRVPGREAERVARSLDFEGGQLNEALAVFRKIARAAKQPDTPTAPIDPYLYEQERAAEAAVRERAAQTDR